MDIYIASCAKQGGIYRYDMNENGELKFVSKTDIDRPMYMVEDNGKMYVAVREPFENSKESGVVSYKLMDGELIKPSEIKSTKGVCACHLLADKGDVYCVNYVSGSIIKMPDKLVTHSGHGLKSPRQDSPHLHFVTLSPDKKYIYAVDLGLDSIFVYDRDLNFVSSAKVPSGEGARHLAFHADKKTVFCVNEIGSSVSVFKEENDELKHIETVSALPGDFEGQNTAAAIRCQGDYVYVSNRGHNTIVCFKYENGHLEKKSTTDCGGRGPRDFNIAGDYIICTNENSNNVTVFKLDKEKLVKTNTELKLDTPLCVLTK